MPKPTCSVEGCERPSKTRGWCNAHSQRFYKTGNPTGIRPARWDGYERPACSVPGCDVLAHARGYCPSHFFRWRRHGDPLVGRRNNAKGTVEERFWSFVDKAGPDDCWLWNGGLITGGYALFHADPGVTVYAHRWSYEHHIGPIPEGLVVDHTCHNRDLTCPGGACKHRSCMNPAHYEAIDNVKNMQRGVERLRKASA